MNVSNLKSQKFHKMMQDAGICEYSMRTQNGQITGEEATLLSLKKKIDLVFCSSNKHKANMNFETFLSSLSKIAELSFPMLDKVQGLQRLINEHFVPLYEKIEAQKKYVDKEKNFEIQYDELVAIVLKSVGLVLYEIY